VRSVRSLFALAVALLLGAGAALAQSRGGGPGAPSPWPSSSPGPNPSPWPSPSASPVPSPGSTVPSSEEFDAAIARQQRDQARRDLQALEQRQQTFERTLVTPDRERLQPELREMERLREQARTQLRAMDAELARDAPDPDRLRAQHEQLEREIDRLERESRELR
jgi:hypothetical protein